MVIFWVQFEEEPTVIVNGLDMKCGGNRGHNNSKPWAWPNGKINLLLTEMV